MGHDRFEFTIYSVFASPDSLELVEIADTGPGRGRRDVIGDFEEGTDILALEGYGIRDFIGTAPFSGNGVGQVRHEFQHGNTVLQLRGTAILSPDIFPSEIELRGIHHLAEADFRLI